MRSISLNVDSGSPILSALKTASITAFAATLAFEIASS